MLESSKSTKPKSRLRLTVVAIPTAGLLFLGSTVTSQAFFTPEVIEQIDHFVECFGWMVTDPEMHNAKCSPPNYVWPAESLSGSDDGDGPDVIVTTTTTTTTTTTGTGGGNEGGNNEGGSLG